MGMSDAEGNLARLIDKLFPDSGLGSSTRGEELDPIADTLAVLEVGTACLFAQRVPKAAKAAVAISLGHEVLKAGWAFNANRRHQNVSGGERLKIKPTPEGKASMAEKLSSIGLAVLASDFDDAKIRTVLSAASLAFAGTGSLRAEKERQRYAKQAEEMIAAYLD
jgi:phosphatidylglycerophosphate synthase